MIKEKLLKLDTWAIDKVQDAYLWVFDWTGVFLGTLLFLDNSAAACLLIERGWTLAGGFVFLVGVVLSGMYYYYQGAGMKEAINLQAEREQTESIHIKFRSFFVMANIISLAMPPYTLSYSISFALNIFFWYLLCVKVRDREPKEFKFFKTASHGAS